MPDFSGVTEDIEPGLGFTDYVRGAQPAAGANFSLALDPAFEWRFAAIVFQLVTDANPANRIVSVDYLDVDGGAVCRNGPGLTVAASLTVTFSGKRHQGVSDWTTSGTDITPVYFPLEPLLLVGSQTLRITVVNIQAGDQLSAIRYAVEKFSTGRRNHRRRGLVRR